MVMDAEAIKKRIESTFNEVSTRYDRNHFFVLSAQQMVERGTEGLEPSHPLCVLDVSTGTGNVAIALAEKLPNAHIEGVDLSLGMLTQAQDNVAKKGLTHITFRQCDAESLPYENATFDLITCGYALFFYPNMETTYQAMCQKVKPGGRLIFSSFTQEAFTPYAELCLQRLEKEYGIEPPRAMMARLKTVQQMEALATLSQPKKVDIKHGQIRYQVSLLEWWDLLNNAGYKGLIDQLSPEQFVQFKKDHLAEIEVITTNGRFELNADTWFALVQF